MKGFYVITRNANKTVSQSECDAITCIPYGIPRQLSHSNNSITEVMIVSGVLRRCFFKAGLHWRISRRINMLIISAFG